jgi:hypothetical protein
MSRGLGKTQLKLLAALRHHGREARLESLAALSAGLIGDLGSRVPFGRAPSRSQYVATSRAVATLRRRGLVDVQGVGTKRGKMEWPRRPDGTVRPVWRFRNPSRYALVRVSVDTSPPENAELEGTAGEDK